MPGTAPLSPIASDICLRDLSFRRNLRMMIRENIVLRGKLGRQHCPSGEEVGDLLADMEKRMVMRGATIGVIRSWMFVVFAFVSAYFSL